MTRVVNLRPSPARPVSVAKPTRRVEPITKEAVYHTHNSSAIQVAGVIERMYATQVMGGKEGKAPDISDADVDFAASLVTYHQALLEVVQEYEDWAPKPDELLHVSHPNLPPPQPPVQKTAKELAKESRMTDRRNVMRKTLHDAMDDIPYHKPRIRTSLYEQAKMDYFKEHHCPHSPEALQKTMSKKRAQTTGKPQQRVREQQQAGPVRKVLTFSQTSSVSAPQPIVRTLAPHASAPAGTTSVPYLDEAEIAAITTAAAATIRQYAAGPDGGSGATKAPISADAFFAAQHSARQRRDSVLGTAAAPNAVAAQPSKLTQPQRHTRAEVVIDSAPPLSARDNPVIPVSAPQPQQPSALATAAEQKPAKPVEPSSPVVTQSVPMQVSDLEATVIHKTMTPVAWTVPMGRNASTPTPTAAKAQTPNTNRGRAYSREGMAAHKALLVAAAAAEQSAPQSPRAVTASASTFGSAGGGSRVANAQSAIPPLPGSKLREPSRRLSMSSVDMAEQLRVSSPVKEQSQKALVILKEQVRTEREGEIRRLARSRSMDASRSVISADVSTSYAAMRRASLQPASP
eukprot:TRINITY_DN7994_c0_g1_i1.p2 TRINITY_DN7994_c0_g1~~TRINITY_DN7994_c0_g1_i1.p2  ORF type:complete len:573 (-),score=142.73 TRINITY_DN7994_c0_g1_i1:1917-3635(-)